jgi:hypothetical protein
MIGAGLAYLEAKKHLQLALQNIGLSASSILHWRLELGVLEASLIHSLRPGPARTLSGSLQAQAELHLTVAHRH